MVREASPNDQGGVADIIVSATATLRKTYRPTGSACSNKRRNSSPFTRLVAICEDKIVGTVEYKIEKDRLHLLGLGVLSEYRNRGIAGQLIDRMAEIGIKSGLRRLSLYTIKETGNISIFRKMGFNVIKEGVDGSLESDNHHRLIEVYMAKELT
jgi:ribosomal protein S18 acetylase RimI-like enzyme